MRILLLGKSGQLGQELERTLPLLGELTAFDRSQFNLSDGDSVSEMVRSVAPSIIVNAAAYTAVDQAEDEPDLAYQVNARAPGLLAQEAARLGAGFIHFSTDYVFDGSQDDPYDEQAEPHPLGVYGQSKLEGEKLIEKAGGKYLIFRTSWVYRLIGNHTCFPKRVLEWARKKSSLRIADDQIGTPTWARDLAAATALVIGSDSAMDTWLPRATGVFHLASQGKASRYDWAQTLLDQLPSEIPQSSIMPVRAKSAEFPTRAARPPQSVLDCGKFKSAFGFGLPDWKSSFILACREFFSITTP